jgi:TIR domain/SIR2-like domain
VTAQAGAAVAEWLLWDADTWPDLLTSVGNRAVIPIIGRDSYEIEVDGRKTTVDRFIAGKLAEQYSLAIDGVMNPSLNSVVALLLQQGKRRQTLSGAIKAMVERANLAIPETLLQLASISHFNLFMTTSFDPLLEYAINQVRFGGDPRTESIAYVLNEPRDIEKSVERPTVYYLLGRMSTAVRYAISDDDLLEFVFALQAGEGRPKNLFDALRDNNLLLIGRDFPDWLVRLFLRTAKGKPLSTERDVLEILADDRSLSDRDLVYYLKSFSRWTRIYSGDAPQFVAELYRAWREQFPPTLDGGVSEPLPPVPLAEMPSRAVFISYAREDLPAVQNLSRRLHAAGIEFWFDLSTVGSADQRLVAGDDWDRKIRHNIQRCSLFIAVLSRNTESRVEGYFHKEWKFATERGTKFAEGIPFIMPTVIDDTSTFRLIPDAFRAAYITASPDGNVDDGFIDSIKAAMLQR